MKRRILAIDFASSPFYVNTKLQDFPVADTPRRAGLNSLGIGGTNAFALLEEAPPTRPTRTSHQDHSRAWLPFQPKALTALVARVAATSELARTTIPMHRLVTFATRLTSAEASLHFALPRPPRSSSELKKHLTAWLRTASRRCIELAAHQ